MAETRLPTPEEIARAVRYLRKHLGWKQINLAHEAGVTERTVQRVERGESVDPNTLRRIATALESDDPDLFTRPREVPSPEELEAEAANYTTVDVSPVSSGRHVVSFLTRCQMFDFDHPDPENDEQADIMTELLDGITDWEMALSDEPPSAGIAAGRYFGNLLARLADSGLKLYVGERDLRMRLKDQPEAEPFPWRVGYVFVRPDEEPVTTKAVVPKAVEVAANMA